MGTATIRPKDLILKIEKINKLSPVDKMLINDEKMKMTDLFKAYGVKPKKNISFSFFGVHFSISY